MQIMQRSFLSSSQMRKTGRNPETGFTIHSRSEYHMDENGKEVPYQNDKMVTPGQEISKIIEVQVEGTKGKIWQLIKPGKPTGDASNMILWGTAAGVGVCILAICIYKKKKEA